MPVIKAFFISCEITLSFELYFIIESFTSGQQHAIQRLADNFLLTALKATPRTVALRSHPHTVGGASLAVKKILLDPGLYLDPYPLKHSIHWQLFLPTPFPRAG